MYEGITQLAGDRTGSWAERLRSSDGWTKRQLQRELLDFLNRRESLCTPGYILRRQLQMRFPELLSEAGRRCGLEPGGCADLSSSGNLAWPERLTHSLAQLLAEREFEGYGGRMGIDSRQWQGYLEDRASCSRETAVKLIFALGLDGDEAGKFLLAGGREPLGLRNPFDFICSYCLGHRPPLSYLKARELMVRFEAGRSGELDGRAGDLPFHAGMTASMEERLRSLLEAAPGPGGAEGEDGLIAYMLRHEGEFTARYEKKNQAGKPPEQRRLDYAPGFSLRNIRMLKVLLRYMAVLYPAAVGLDGGGQAVNIPVETDAEGVPLVYSRLTQAMFDMQDIEFADRLELKLPARGREKLAYDRRPFNESILLPLKNLSSSLRAMTRSAEAPANCRSVSRSTVLLLAYFFISGYQYVPPRDLPLPSAGIEDRLEEDLRLAQDMGDLDSARMLYVLQDVTDRLSDTESDTAGTCISCPTRLPGDRDPPGLYPPFVLDRFIFLCLQADPMNIPLSPDGALPYLMQLLITESSRLDAQQEEGGHD